MCDFALDQVTHCGVHVVAFALLYTPNKAFILQGQPSKILEWVNFTCCTITYTESMWSWKWVTICIYRTFCSHIFNLTKESVTLHPESLSAQLSSSNPAVVAWVWFPLTAPLSCLFPISLLISYENHQLSSQSAKNKHITKITYTWQRHLKQYNIETL